MKGKRCLHAVWLSLLPLAVLVSCMPREPKEEKDIVLQVSLANTKGLEWVYLYEVNIRDLKKLDSFNVKKTGRHTFRTDPGEPGFYLLEAKPGENITLLLAPGERAELVADAREMQKKYEIKGSPGSALLRDYFFKTRLNLAKVDSLREEFNKARNTSGFIAKREELDSAYRQIFNAQRKLVIDFARMNCQSIASIFVLNQRLGPNQIMNERNDFQYFRMIDSCLIAKYPKNKHVLDHHERVSKVLRKEAEKKLADERLAAGKTAPEITLPDQFGKELKLSSMAGKDVLLYFWKGTAAQARQDHGLMKSFYKEHHRKGFEILSVSLDANEEMWRAALKLDALPWINLRDPQGESSSLWTVYDLDNELPTYYLIDKKGSIVSKGKKFKEMKEGVLRLISQ